MFREQNVAANQQLSVSEQLFTYFRPLHEFYHLTPQWVLATNSVRLPFELPKETSNA